MSSTPADVTNIALETTGSEPPRLVSLTDWAAETDPDQPNPALTVLRIRTEPAYLSLFTDEGARVTTHFLERTETRAGGYVHCLKQNCPACAAQIDRKQFVLLPVADLTDSGIKILQVPSEKGPGKLLTEIGKVLSLPNRAEIVTKIHRTANYQYVVDAHRQNALNPDVTAVIKRFVEELNANLVDLRSVVSWIPASEMAQHERIAKRLELEGRRV